MGSTEERRNWGEFPEVEVSEADVRDPPSDSVIDSTLFAALEQRAVEKSRKGVEGFQVIDVSLRQLMKSTVDVLLHHFDDELAQVGPILLQAEYRDNTKAKKDYMAVPFSGAVVEKLEIELAKEAGFVPDLFRVVHQPYWNDHHETHKEAYPFFDFNVEIPIVDDSFSQGGCRLVVTASSYVDIGQDTLDQVFRYARQYVALQSVVQTALSLYSRPAPKGSILEDLLNLAAPYNLTDEAKHVSPPGQELGSVSYELSVCLAVLPKQVMVEFRDTSGLIFRSAKARQAIADYLADGSNASGDSGVVQQDFRIVKNELDSSSEDADEHRYVTVLVRDF